MGQLTQVLRDFSTDDDPRLLVGPQSVDDAGVILLGAADGFPEGLDIALVQTVDYFPPIVDDPYLYGAVAAANALSDVYAMGGRPISALNLAGFPKGFRQDWVKEIFRGGFDKVRESGATLAGGHTVQGAEPIFGFAVTGVVDRNRVTDNAGAKVGDAIYLTKRLGMGTMTTASKIGRIEWEAFEPAVLQMATLNERAALAMMAADGHACTDITGFGLIGHSLNVARGSGVCVRFETAALPIFPGALELARDGVITGSCGRGKEELSGSVNVGAGVEEALVNITYDAETSGGLLIFVAADRAQQLEQELGSRDVAFARVGEVTDGDAGTIQLL